VLLQGLLKLCHHQQVLRTFSKDVAAQLQQRMDFVAFGRAFIVFI
jgi:hypothetical protein